MRELQDSEGLIAVMHARAPAAPSMVAMLQAQSDRLAAMEQELDKAQRSLNERKVIERAKGVLMAQMGVTEENAYKMLRKAAMDLNRRISEVAETILALPNPQEVLHGLKP
ncbi:MAG: ANTAR domain-containing protein [Candidatus Protistobacter heckmanni]|nr:ANTAR domain-containing protein [Candidatus Protistobacter heckmanni]